MMHVMNSVNRPLYCLIILRRRPSLRYNYTTHITSISCGIYSRTKSILAQRIECNSLDPHKLESSTTV